MAAGEMRFALTLDSSQFTAAAAGAGTSTKQLAAASTAASASIGALRNSMQVIGNVVAPQATFAVMAGAQALNAVRQAAVATGTGLAGAGVAVAGVAAAFVTWAEAIEWVRSELDLVASDKGLADQYDLHSRKLKERIELEMKAKRLSEFEGVGALNLLDTADNPKLRQEALDNAYNVLKPLNEPDKQREAGDKLEDMLAPIRAAGLSGKAREKALFDLQQTSKLNEALALAGAAGVSERSVLEVFEQANKVAYAEMDKQSNTGQNRYRPDVTSIEKMGFVMGGGSADYTRETARNTREHTQLLKQIVTNTNTQPSNSFANLN